MTRYLVKFRPFVNEKERQEFTSELAQNGGHLIKSSTPKWTNVCCHEIIDVARVPANLYRYEMPGEDLHIQNFDTRKFVDVSRKKEPK